MLAAATASAALLTAFSGGYGFHRDELYVRMLEPAPGYVDQPPLTVLMAHLTRLIADEPWALRIPATLAAALSVPLLALITRELGGGGRAQALCAWGVAFAPGTLILGHLLLTSSLDLITFPALVLCALRTARDPRWWLAVGAVVGLATWNRWLVVVLVAGLVLGLLLLGPRRRLLTPQLLAGGALAAVLAAPNLAYQAGHGWPQLAMGEALREQNGGEVRVMVPLMLVLLLGPVLFPVWVAGLVALWRREVWRPHRWLIVVCVVGVVFTWVSAAQVHYLMLVLPTMYAVGCVPVAEWLAREPGRPLRAAIALGLNSAVAAVLALPILPVSGLRMVPVTEANPTVGDTIGWPRYVDQVEDAAKAVGATEVVTSNYGEAGALARFGRLRVFSGHNGLWDRGHPSASTVVVVGGQFDRVRASFASCEVVAELDNGLEIDNEEQGEPIAVCRDPLRPWPQLWASFRHLS